MRTYAIGDVHGRYDLLDVALARIDGEGGADRRVILLGDYVDRGPQSREVVERLMAETARGRVQCLKGNHETLMVAALRGREAAAVGRWLYNGGLETLESYGSREADLDAVPADHLAWMEALPSWLEDERRVFVHAGLAPRTPMSEQGEGRLLWIREAFLTAPAKAFERHVVHGHTTLWAGKPDEAAPELLPHRTNLDTAAWCSGVLTVGVFDRSQDGPVDVWGLRRQDGQAASSSSMAASSVSMVCRDSENRRM